MLLIYLLCCVYLSLITHWRIRLNILEGTSGYYQFPTLLELFEEDIKLKYYDPELSKNCKLCDFISDNEISDSTKKDVIIAFAAKKVMNIALL